MLKQVFLLVIHFLQVVSKAIRIFQNLPTFDDFYDWVIEEFKFHLWIWFELVQHLDLASDDWLKSDGKLLRLVVIEVSLKVEHISLQLKLCIFFHFVFCLVFNKLVAFVVSTSWGVVIFPITKTQPAEVLHAHLALNVVASLVLFNWSPTLRIWTILTVCKYPVDVFTFAWVLHFPLFEHVAISRTMLLLSTLEAVGVITNAVDDWSCRVIEFVGCILAATEWTPSYILVVIREWFAVHTVVLCKDLFVFYLGQNFDVLWVENHHVASFLLASCLQTLWSKFHLLCQVLLPAADAELMTASQMIDFTIRICLGILEVRIAYNTKSTIKVSFRWVYFFLLCLWKWLKLFLVKFQTNDMTDLLLLVKPLFIHFLFVPVEISHYLDCMVLW